MSSMVITFDVALGAAILDVLVKMIVDGEMRWGRNEILTSDEAARAIIARLPVEFRSIDANHFRRIADPLEKTAKAAGGFPHFTDRQSRPESEVLSDRLQRWHESREHIHSDEYGEVLNSGDHREKCARWKEQGDFRCVACGEQQRGDLLEIHHYTYIRIGKERDEDVCCVCSPKTKRPCHALLDFARECKNGKVVGGLFT